MSFGCKKTCRTELALLFFLVGLGIYSSLKTFLATSTIENDSIFSLLMWEGVRQHGLVWLESWHYTIDNWLLSLIPMLFVQYKLFGASPQIPLFFGWFIFLCNAVVAALITLKITNKIRSLFVFAILLNLNFFSHYVGFVSYSSSHNVTNLFGLISLLTLISWIDKPNLLKLSIILLMIVCGSLSDPWMIAGYTIPIFIFSIIFLISSIHSRRKYTTKNAINLLLTLLLAILLIKTQALSILKFTPETNINIVTWKKFFINLHFYIKSLGLVFNVIPLEKVTTISRLFSFWLIFSLIIFGLFIKIKKDGIYNYNNYTILITLLSISGMSGAFLISDLQANEHAARFLINIIYLTPILLAILMPNKTASCRLFNWSVITTTGFFFFSSLISNWGHINNLNFRFRQNADVIETISLLKNNNLTYGYGSYWGSGSNTISVMTSYNIIVRPVSFNSQTGELVQNTRAETSSYWYKAEDIPTGLSNFFIHIKSDGEECPSIDICLNGIKKQFGKPDRIIKNKGAFIYVYKIDLLLNKLTI